MHPIGCLEIVPSRPTFRRRGLYGLSLGNNSAVIVNTSSEVTVLNPVVDEDAVVVGFVILRMFQSACINQKAPIEQLIGWSEQIAD